MKSHTEVQGIELQHIFLREHNSAHNNVKESPYLIRFYVNIKSLYMLYTYNMCAWHAVRTE